MTDVDPVHYRITPADTGAHHFRVSVHVPRPDPAGQVLSIPAWIPGSYLVRDYARHVLEITAHSTGTNVDLVKTDKATWRASPCTGPLTVDLLVYANDLSVRGAHLDNTHGYFNGCCVFPRVHGRDSSTCRVTLVPGPERHCADWRVATSMRRAGAAAGGFGDYEAADYDELIDHPVEIGTFQLGRFEACGVPHQIAITGVHRADMDRLCRDLAVLCTHHIRFFGEPPPIDRYLFLVTALGEGYGGLEHRWSTSLICQRDDLPVPGRPRISDGYRRFLGLCSHEYFHLWNVKRMRPAAFAESDLSAEAPSQLLWVFEGITSYYDDLGLLRSGLIQRNDYLKLLAGNATRVCQSRGRHRQSLADSSFDAWIKLYKRDENAANAMVSYYTKGAMAALALDLTIRRDTGDRCSLDHVMREMWRRYPDPADGLGEAAFEALACEVSGLDLAAFFDQSVRGTGDLPWADLLGQFGVETVMHYEGHKADSPPPEDPRPKAALELTVTDTAGRAAVSSVFEGGPAHAAGVSAGDELLALDGVRVTPANYDNLLDACDPGDPVTLTVFRRDELMTLDAVLGEAPRNVCEYRLMPSVPAEIARRRDHWLGSADTA